jgi:hypothetical protein
MEVLKMYDKLRTHVDELFNSAPKTRKAKELKEEILANLIDRYNDFSENGKSEIDAFNNAISGIGDVEELINALNENDVFDYEKIQKQREKHAFNVAISVALYIIGAAIVILFDSLGLDTNIAAAIMLIIDAFATGLIIYSTMTRPKYVKADDTMVEDFKEWKQQSSNKKVMLKSINSIFWPIIVAIYLLMSFVFHIWAYSWIIFIIGIAMLNIIRLIFDLKEN